MTQERNHDVNEADTQQSEHEREVAQHEDHGTGSPSSDATVDEGRRPPHPSQAEGGSTEPAARPPRPSQAEGER